MRTRPLSSERIKPLAQISSSGVGRLFSPSRDGHARRYTKPPVPTLLLALRNSPVSRSSLTRGNLLCYGCHAVSLHLWPNLSPASRRDCGSVDFEPYLVLDRIERGFNLIPNGTRLG